jgi:arylsulfatase A-like enzyme
VISEQSTGFPGYNSIIERDKATIGRLLKDNGYSTAWFGKDHNVPAFQASQSGPFDQWPTGMGFDYFYGFVGGDANQWQPNLFRNTTQIYPFEGKEPGSWNLVTAMADDAIGSARPAQLQMHSIPGQPPLWIWLPRLPRVVDAPLPQQSPLLSPCGPGESWPGGLDAAAVHRADHCRGCSCRSADPPGHQGSRPYASRR